MKVMREEGTLHEIYNAVLNVCVFLAHSLTHTQKPFRHN
jgi:hypothetical protein